MANSKHVCVNLEIKMYIRLHLFLPHSNESFIFFEESQCTVTTAAVPSH